MQRLRHHFPGEHVSFSNTLLLSIISDPIDLIGDLIGGSHGSGDV
jgi:hypothetical protein